MTPEIVRWLEQQFDCEAMYRLGLMPEFKYRLAGVIGSPEGRVELAGWLEQHGCHALANAYRNSEDMP